ncbi:cysteine--1-D-myo-inosityl 2-amino-2-deoxy-alpha-D-glucopyranoside ligase [Tessaracoccus flavus]|uniref:L-cysteine:1D-myo-inositol 2-amino-2-deoxy-alpha-D-glucopyranoside ligase n=1 Tax=Tessaracoccus flavus TaxID=1610493 RepID=A0A1Q2CFB4_9ACTN|nr:cysteine--1-D-myo-inosityl 2-amino-2-deoxy-alpha-D-glucopyranoside ligase [Tessaracoccus flavus]AQP44801.1 cysteine--1-D-myo-inosityl 2-amino-2-deoxy-alpha-D-glucopyranoside ligase [Tessaracoccus flavus]SDZ19267.1 cysteinyl-tRNA synthetase [Tessaracoccus flavus]
MYAWAPVAVPSLPKSDDSVPGRLTLFDTAAQSLTEVGPNDGAARMYVCGITPYDATHLGHANTYVTFDLVQRVWLDLGLDVDYTQNVTDVDDPLLERAAETGQEWEELAEDQIELFRSDMQDLRVIPPRHYIGAVESISCVIDLIEQLLPSGLVYQVDDDQHPDWYFNTVGAEGFGGVSNLDESRMIELFRENGGDPDRPGKRHPLDCLVWRFARPDEPSWTSSLGAGRPGWHIECTAIAMRYLGPNFDVQGGGSDLVFPHHEMCAAEAIAAAHEPMAEAFVHSGMVGLDGEKMSKSKGNLELVSRLRHAGADPMAIRLALMDNHYRSNWDWTPDKLERATERLTAWRGVLNNATAMPAGETIAAMRTALRNDLNAPAALATVDAWVAASMAIESDDTSAVSDMVQAIDALLGIKL